VVSGETLKLYAASLALIALIVVSAVAFHGTTVSTVWESNAPCASPASGPPGGCLMPAGTR